MVKILTTVGAALVLLLSVQERAPAEKKAIDLQTLGWLAGEWRGKAGTADVVSWHSDPAGGMIVMATKELEGGKLSLFDFGVVSERQGKVGYVPYPYGKPSVVFLLEDYDPEVRKARFVNAKHDFPKSFLFERRGKDELAIVLEGDEGGKPTRVEYALALFRQ